MSFGHFGKVAPDFAFETGQKQAIEGVEGGFGEELALGMPFQGQLAEDRALDVLAGQLEFDLENRFFIAAVDRQDAVRRDVIDRFGVVEIIAEIESLSLGDVVGLGGDDLTGLPDDAARGVANLGKFADRLGQDVADPFEDFLRRVEFFLGVDELGGGAFEVDQGFVAAPNPNGERFQPLLAGLAGLGFFLGL